MGLGINYVILANHLVSLITSSTTNPRFQNDIKQCRSGHAKTNILQQAVWLKVAATPKILISLSTVHLCLSIFCVVKMLRNVKYLM